MPLISQNLRRALPVDIPPLISRTEHRPYSKVSMGEDPIDGPRKVRMRAVRPQCQRSMEHPGSDIIPHRCLLNPSHSTKPAISSFWVFLPSSISFPANTPPCLRRLPIPSHRPTIFHPTIPPQQRTSKGRRTNPLLKQPVTSIPL